MSKQEVERIKAPIDTVLLDDIARGITDIKGLLEAQVPEGLKEEVAWTVEGTRAVPVSGRLIRPPYFRATVFNDGPDPVYVFLNKAKPRAYREAPLNAGDKLDIDTTEAKIQVLFFAGTTSAGRASGRVHFLK